MYLEADVGTNASYGVGNVGNAYGLEVVTGDFTGLSTTEAAGILVANPAGASSNYAIKHSNTTANLDTAGTWNNASSGQYKENVQSIDEALAITTIMGLEPVTYDSILAPEENKYAGFIAEDLPQSVSRKDGKTVNPMDFIAMLTKVVQVQQKKIEELEALINNGS
jgi:hypothetical protein